MDEIDRDYELQERIAILMESGKYLLHEATQIATEELVERLQQSGVERKTDIWGN